ncbi:MAG: ergothioneine biosynthesis protein EgtB, partial [Thermoleophilaceae bacterium]|nr:ergothioneine biosynthesis protein EgtB [Thermoleophilaceae bacterium]
MDALTHNTQQLWEALEDSRIRSFELVDGLSEQTLAAVVSPLLSPLIWDLGHIANFEQRWLLGHESSLDGLYNPFDNPRDTRGQLPVLAPQDCFAYMDGVREQVGHRVETLDPYLMELVIQHEQQHNETMLQLLRMVDDYRPNWQDPSPHPRSDLGTSPRSDLGAEGSYWLEVPAGEFVIGRDPRDAAEFVYDNEQRSHLVTLAGAQIARRPVTNAEFLEWVERGGYRDDECWSAAGRAWRDKEAATQPLGWLRDGEGGWVERNGGIQLALEPQAPVIHVSWFEADAFARAHDARLPSEFEWEVAAAFDPASGEGSLQPWGQRPWCPGDANLDQRSFGSTACSSSAARTPLGFEQMLGQVWEWTS